MSSAESVRSRSPRMLRWWLLLPFLPLSLFAQENTIRVIFGNDPSRFTTIGVFRQHGILYGSVNDMAQVFSLGLYENPHTGKLEIKQPPYRVTVSARSPFIVITDESRQRTAHQLAAPVITAAGAYFAPLASFIPLVDQVFNLSVSYDERAGVVRLGFSTGRPRYDIAWLRFEQKANGMLIRVPVSKRLDDFESWLKQDGWLYVTIADAKADIETINRIKPQGLIKKIVAIQSPTAVQLTFKLSGKIAGSEIMREEGSNDILITVRTPTPEDGLLLAARRKEIVAGLEEQRRRWLLDVIVIDPGHGGYDPGTIGITGVREKDVTLGVSQKLGRLIERNLKDVKVVYTRNDDRFVELDRRGQIANEAGGKLFISVHANSMPRKPHPTRGFEVYLLRPGRTEEAIAIAERENSVIRLEKGFEERYKKLTDENFILVAMAQSAHMRASEQFAEIALDEMEAHINIPSRGVKQAGFYVLVGASMPNVLIETAYLSNREDERFLRSESGQQKIAESLFRAVKRYKYEYEKLLTEGKEIGQGGASTR